MLLLFSGLALLGSGCRHINYDYSKEVDPRRLEYVLGPSDQLSINVWRSPEFSGSATIRPDGTITLPLLGDIKAAGMTPSALQKTISKLVESYIKDGSAVVTVALTETGSYRYTVSGNAEHSGVYTPKVYVTLLEAVALAGGLNKFASPGGLVIVRTDPANPGKVRRIPVNFNRIANGEHPEENLVMMPGDVLIIP